MNRWTKKARYRFASLAGCLLILGVVGGCGDPGTDKPILGDTKAPADRGSLVLYTSLPHERVLAIADAYRAETGVVVNFLIDTPAALVESLAAKRHSPPADVLLVEGTGPLAGAVEQDVLRPVDLGRSVNSSFEGPADPDGYWFGLGYSVDAIVATPDTNLGGLTYRSLASADFAGRLCLRRGTNERTRGLVATILSESDAESAELVVRGWRNNLARGGYETDDELVQAVAAGRCPVAVAASDAIARYLAASPDESLAVHFPSSDSGLTAVHPVAAGVARHAGRPEAAEAFLRWLLEADAQALLNDGSGRFFLDGKARDAAFPAGGSTIEVPSSGASAAGFVYEDALRLMDRARYL